MDELVVIEKATVPALFSSGGCDQVLRRIQEEAEKFVPDLTTEPGRKAIGSFAHKIARSKTYLDGLGKDLVADIKQQVKVVDAERKKVRDELDTLKEKVRKPLTEWENVEKGRVENIKTWIQEIVTKGEVECDSLDSINQALDELKAIKVETPLDNVYGEFAELAVRKIATAITNLSAAYIVRKKEEDDQAEAARFEAEQAEAERDKIIAERVEEAAREAKEEAARVAAEKDRFFFLAKETVVAAEAGRLAANVATAKAEREKNEGAEQAIKDAEAAKEKAEEEKLAAVEEEKQRQKENKQLQEKIDLAREADKEHRDRIAGEIGDDLNVFPDRLSMVKAIMAGEIRHIKVIF